LLDWYTLTIVSTITISISATVITTLTSFTTTAIPSTLLRKMTLELAIGTEQAIQCQQRFTAVPHLRKRMPQSSWSQSWSVNEKGEKTTTVHGVDANGNPAIQVTVTDSNGNIINQTGNAPVNLPENIAASLRPPSSPSSPPPSASASSNTPSSPSTISNTSPNINLNNRVNDASTSFTNNPLPSPAPSSASPAISPDKIPKTDKQNTQSTHSGLSNTASADDTINHGISSGVIAGIVIGLLVLLALIAFLMRRIMIKRRQQKANARFSAWAPTSAAAQSSSSPSPPMHENIGFNRNNNYFISSTQPIQAASLTCPIVVSDFASRNQQSSNDQTTTLLKESTDTVSPNIARNTTELFVPPAAFISQADLRRDLSPTTNSNNNGNTILSIDDSNPENRKLHRLTINGNISAQNHTAKVAPSIPEPLQLRRISTDRYRPPISSVVMDEQDSCVLESENLNLTNQQDYHDITIDLSQITATRIYLTDEPVTTEEVSDILPSSVSASKLDRKTSESAGTSAVAAANNDIGNVFSLESMLSELRKKKPSRVSAIAERSPSTDVSIRDSIMSMDGKAPSPLVSPTFPSPSTETAAAGATSWKAPRSSKSTLSVHTSKINCSRPPSNVSVVSRQMVPFEAAPMPRAALRVINRHSHDNRS
jgi:hypothetical protein